MDFLFVFSACEFTCHKKCHSKFSKPCKGRRPSVCGPSAVSSFTFVNQLGNAQQYARSFTFNIIYLLKLFGTSLAELFSSNNPIPEAVVKIMLEIEKRGKESLCSLFHVYVLIAVVALSVCPCEAD